MSFLDEKYLLESDAAVSIYNAVKDLPIIDPHNHADVAEIAANGTYSDAWQVFAATDHYVWEVMRKRGVEESRITGTASAKEKWMDLARVMPEIAGNPVFEWIHLDLRRRFGIMDVLCADNAERIWNEVNDKLATDAFRPLALLNAMNVEVMCSTDDPVDLLEEHEKVNQKAGRTLIILDAEPSANGSDRRLIRWPNWCGSSRCRTTTSRKKDAARAITIRRIRCPEPQLWSRPRRSSAAQWRGRPCPEAISTPIRTI